MLRFWRSWGARPDAQPPDSGAALSAEEQQLQRVEAHRDALQAGRRAAIVENLAIIVGCTVVLIGSAIVLPPIGREPWKSIIDLALVTSFSSLVAYGELVSRYRDSPLRLLGAPPTPLYILVNAAAGVAAWLIVRNTDALGGTGAHQRLFEIMLASFGAVAFFRTSFFTVRVGTNDVGVGPSAVLQSLLGAADRMLDRDQAQGRATDVADIMRDVDFRKAQIALSSLCFTLLQNSGLTPDDQKAVSDQIKALADAEGVSDEAKSVILGVYLIRQVGANVLHLAVRALGSQIRRDPGSAPPPPSGAGA